jgi:putative membrane protein insertion efficiency factor
MQIRNKDLDQADAGIGAGVSNMIRCLQRGMVAVLVVLVRAYQVTLGPLMGGRCRFHPSCSEYAIQAVKERGALVGLGLTLRRLARCHPLGGHGLDPVPAGKRPGKPAGDENGRIPAHDSEC